MKFSLEGLISGIARGVQSSKPSITFFTATCSLALPSYVRKDEPTKLGFVSCGILHQYGVDCQDSISWRVPLSKVALYDFSF